MRHLIKLAANENPLGPSPLAVVRMRDSLDHIHLSTPGFDPRSKLAKRFGTQVKNVIIGSVSEGIKANIVR